MPALRKITPDPLPDVLSLLETRAPNTQTTYANAMKYIEHWQKARDSIGRPIQHETLESQMIAFLDDHWKNEPEIMAALIERGARLDNKPHRFNTLNIRISAWAATRKDRVPKTVALVLKRLRPVMQDAGRGVTHTHAVSFSEFQAVLRHIDTTQIIGIRLQAMITTAWYSGGRRASEIALASWENLSPTKKGYKLFLPRHKGDLSRKGLHVPLHGLAYQALKSWRYCCPPDQREVGAIFRKVRGSQIYPLPLSVQSIRLCLKTAFEQCGLPYSAHSIRAGWINWAISQGFTDQQIMDMSGHKTWEAFQIYKRQTAPEINPAGQARAQKRR